MDRVEGKRGTLGTLGTLGTATKNRVKVAGAGPALRASIPCLAAAGITFSPRLGGSPYREEKHQLEEFKGFCSGGQVCARSVPGARLQCPELRAAGPFANPDQSPAEPHCSGAWGRVSPPPCPLRPGPTGAVSKLVGAFGVPEMLRCVAAVGPGTAKEWRMASCSPRHFLERCLKKIIIKSTACF